MVRAASLRHLAIVVAAVVAWTMNRLDSRPSLVFTLGAAAVVNVAMAAVADREPARRLMSGISCSVGILTWAALVASTGGVSSPLVAGFWLEIALSVMVVRGWRVLVIVCAAVAALWVQQGVLGIGAALPTLSVETAFLLATGALTYCASERFAHREAALSANAADLSQRLQRLERELDASQTVGRLGERAARLAHAAKGAVHSLRGFTKLIEAPLLESPAHRKALEGLRLAIDRLDDMARTTLRPPPQEPRGVQGASAADVSRTLDQVIEEIGPLRSGAQRITRSGDGLRGVGLPSAELREVLLALVQNAAEASGPAGQIALRVEVEGRMLRIVVRDHGPGLLPSARCRLFDAGVTTKPAGSGFGLFLARRLVESGGGQLTAESPDDGGALFAVSLPVQD